MDREQLIILIQEQIKDMDILISVIPAENVSDWKLALKLKSNLVDIKEGLRDVNE